MREGPLEGAGGGSLCPAPLGGQAERKAGLGKPQQRAGGRCYVLPTGSVPHSQVPPRRVLSAPCVAMRELEGS